MPLFQKPFRKTAFQACLISLTLLLCAGNAWAMNILLVNDDGCNAPGINALATVLKTRGYNVYMYAPAANQSGQGSRVVVAPARLQYEVSNKDLSGTPTSGKNLHCVTAKLLSNSGSTFPPPFTKAPQTITASPSESARVGLKMMELNGHKADLVISGINSGGNTGSTTVFSGTMAAAVTALREGVPALATSQVVTSQHYTPAAEFIADVVKKLKANERGGKLLPAGIGLNINYPAKTPKGVLYTRIGQFSTVNLPLVKQSDGTLKQGVQLNLKPQGIPAKDIHQEGIALREGYVSISTMTDGYGASRAASALTRLKLSGLKSQ